ncbi:hypothetical protein ABIB94_009044 [Bradyrhizobium sp. JR7.2]
MLQVSPGLRRLNSGLRVAPRGPFCMRGTMDESLRVMLAIGATVAVAAGAFFAIRFIVGFYG